LTRRTDGQQHFARGVTWDLTPRADTTGSEPCNQQLDDMSTKGFETAALALKSLAKGLSSGQVHRNDAGGAVKISP